jgi:hypothetical protein
MILSSGRIRRMNPIREKQQTLDALAVAASGLCLVHCLVLPALLVLVPTLAAFVAVPETFHTVALIFAVPTSALAIAAGFRRHRQLQPTLLVLPGLALLASGALAAEAQWAETVMTVAGALLLSAGHALNWRSLRR